jgi:hypothetical protein
MSSSLKEYVKKLIEYEDLEEKYKIKLNDIKKEKDKINNYLISYLEENNITDKDIIFENKKIKYSSQNITENITKKLILEKLTLFLGNHETAIQALNFIYNDRDKNTKKYIKITNIKNESNL